MKFKKGNVVRCLKDHVSIFNDKRVFTKGKLYTIIEDGDYPKVLNDSLQRDGWSAKHFKIVQDVNKVFNHEELPKTKPKYYKSSSGKDVLDFINDFNLDFFQGNVCKYVVRYKEKNGVEDLKKAREYLDRLIKIEENK